MYNQLAQYYDWTGSLDFTELLVEKTQGLLEARKIEPPAHIVDLACGTGELSFALATAGYTVTGIDQSKAMLAEAGKKDADYINQNLHLTWLQSDMRDFNFSEQATAVVCYNDSINHLLSEADVKACFKAVYDNLKPGGAWWFDTNTLENYQKLWRGKDTDELENGRLVFDSEFDDNTQKAHCKIRWEGYDDANTDEAEAELLVKEDEVIAKYYGNAVIEALLTEAGFVQITSEPFNPYELLPNNQPIKTFWQAFKP